MKKFKELLEEVKTREDEIIDEIKSLKEKIIKLQDELKKKRDYHNSQRKFEITKD